MRCNICNSTDFGNQGARHNVRCLKCGSLERTRALKLHLDKIGLPKQGDKVLHIAPERHISGLLREGASDGYDAVDLFPELFPFAAVRKFDLCSDAEFLPPESYDCIIHSHVLEHLPCNWTMVLLFLHRALKAGGRHIFCVPILSGRYEESLQPLTTEEAVRRFGQNDHVRRIGRDDLDLTLGLVFKGGLDRHVLANCFSDDVLAEANIPEAERRTLNSSTIFVFGKGDIRIAS